jgi:hypothetical protein
MGKKKRNGNSGHSLSYTITQGIVELKRGGFSHSEIARRMHCSRTTVVRVTKSYAEGVLKLPAMAETSIEGIPRAHVEVSSFEDGSGELQAREGYNPAKSLTSTLELIGTTKAHLLSLARSGALPTVATPLMIKQLAEAERSVLTLPQELNKGRQSLYEQIQGRSLECDDSELAAFGAGGGMGREGADQCDDTGTGAPDDENA